MAKGKNENGMRWQYERILGRPTECFDIVCLRFPDDHRRGIFHFLALNLNLRGLLYDNNDTQGTVTIVYDKGSQNAARARRVAVDELGATEITPIL